MKQQICVFQITQYIEVALDNMVFVATSDQTLVSKLVESNTALTKTVQELTEQLTMDRKRSAHSPVKKQQDRSVTTNHAPSFKAMDVIYDTYGYCYNHGYKVHYGRSSIHCTNKNLEHKYEAKRSNTMGGSSKFKNWVRGSQT